MTRNNKLINIKFEKLYNGIKLSTKYYDNILSVFRYLENEYNNYSNTELKQFWDLAVTCSTVPPGEQYYKTIVRMREIFPDTNDWTICKKININSITVFLKFKITFNSDLRLIHLLHFKGIEDKLEQLIIGTRN